MSIKTELRDLTFAVGNISKLTFGDRVYIDKPLLSRIEQLEWDKKDLELIVTFLRERITKLEELVWTSTYTRPDSKVLSDKQGKKT